MGHLDIYLSNLNSRLRLATLGTVRGLDSDRVEEASTQSARFGGAGKVESRSLWQMILLLHESGEQLVIALCQYGRLQRRRCQQYTSTTRTPYMLDAA